MTETPECPYCGAEMDLNDNNEGVYWYECNNCGSTTPIKKSKGAALGHALRRAEPENRVLTLEELEEHCAKGPGAEPLWIEFAKKCAISR